MSDIKTPRWETAVLFLSFLALWAWWMARQSQGRLEGGLTEHPLTPVWNGLLVASLVALIAVFIRRIRRVQSALSENLQSSRAPFGGIPAEVQPARKHGGGKHEPQSRKR